jgi:hypothetical protein
MVGALSRGRLGDQDSARRLMLDFRAVECQMGLLGLGFLIRITL